MADIFISYSKPDRFEVEKLAAMLEAEGWSVWWDKGLSPGDTYRDEIMKELVRARAVVAVWTANSIKSDWVRAEAGQAKATGKLIPVKVDGVGYGDIPLPFGEMHTEPVGNAAQIRAAIVAQLAKPQVQPSGIWMATAELRYAFLTWFGIIGGAITLFSGLNGLIPLADLAKRLVENWQEWTRFIWERALGFFGLEDLVLYFGSTLTFVFFAAATIVATGLARRATLSHAIETKPSLVMRPLGLAVLVLIGPVVTVGSALVLPFLPHVLISGIRDHVSEETLQALFFVSGLAPMVLFYLMCAWLCRDRLAAAGFVLLSLPFPVLLALAPVLPFLVAGHGDILSDLVPLVLPLLVSVAFVPIALAVRPARQLNRRFVLILVGVAMLLALSELAKSGVLQRLS